VVDEKAAMAAVKKEMTEMQGISEHDQKSKISDKSVTEKDKAQLQDYKDTLQRLQAEFENYKKRIEREIAKQHEYNRQDFMERLLPIIDSFELALKSQSDSKEFRKGVELIYTQLYSLLESEGLRPIEALGKQFDPYKHEALMNEKSGKDNIVLEEFQKGYMLKDSVLRHSKVKIGVKK